MDRASHKLTYGADLAELGRPTAQTVHELLGRAKPGDIPICQPTNFELVINLKTSNALDLTNDAHRSS